MALMALQIHIEALWHFIS